MNLLLYREDGRQVFAVEDATYFRDGDSEDVTLLPIEELDGYDADKPLEDEQPELQADASLDTDEKESEEQEAVLLEGYGHTEGGGTPPADTTPQGETTE
jgi:hypothetical protein